MQSKVTNRDVGERDYMTQRSAWISVGEGELYFTLQKQLGRYFVVLGRFVLTKANVILYSEEMHQPINISAEFKWIPVTTPEMTTIGSKVVLLLWLTSVVSFGLPSSPRP